jgi:hypothetical protein
MYTVGLQSAADAFLLSSLKAQVALALLVLFILLGFGFGSQKDGVVDGAPVFLPGSHLLAITPFFRRRFEFLNDGFRKTGQTLFQFNMLRVSVIVAHLLQRPLTTILTQETVIVVSGESARKSFFANKHFDLTEGFKMLSGAVSIFFDQYVPILTSFRSLSSKE